TAGPRDLPERQQTINATVAWSYQLLDSDERGVFRRLGALPGRFPVGAAAAVLRGAHRSVPRCTETLQSLAGLIDRSLLSKAESTLPNRPVFQMLETVRAYAALELSASGEREDAMEGMAAYCIREASAAGDGLVGPAQLDWLNRVRDDLDLYRGALAWLIERGRAAEASQIASNLLFFWVIRGHAAEGLRWLEQILSVPSLPQAAESHALAVAGMLRYTQGELGPAREALERACLIAERAGDGQTHVRAQSLLGHVEHASGHLKAARERFAASVEGSRALSMPWSTGIALAGLAWVALATGDLDESERLLDESDSSLQVAGPWFLLLSLYIRAVLSVRRGDPDQAIKLAHQSLARISELHDKFAFVYALVPLAAAAVRKGDSAWAARILGAGEVMSEQTGAMMVDQSVLDLHRQTEREARMRLGPSRWEREHAAGRRASVESLLKEIERAVNTA
ncbi:MAG: ATP-binding protein, partial [Acidobacteriota bacterium]